MSILALALLAFAPQGEAQAPRPTFDRVNLRAGSALEGTITVDTKEYLEIRLADGTTVGFEKKIVESIQRGALPAPDASGRDKSLLTARDRWYLLHDGEGALRGRLHETVTVGEEIRLGEEWQLADEKGVTEITLLEVLGADLRPLSCFVHERTMEADGSRLASERVVRAKLVAGKLEVVTKTLRGDETRSYEISEGTTFPLAAAERVRREATGESSGTVAVFDPRCEEIRSIAWRNQARRQVQDGKKALDVRELRLALGKVENLEWLDAAGLCVRREVNGPSLVAVPTSADTAKGVRKFGTPTGAGATRKERRGRFGLWLPSPSWRGEGEVSEGVVVVRSSIDDAEIGLVAIDHLDADLGLDSAGDTVARWSQLLRPGLRIDKRSKSAVRGWPAVLLDGTFTKTAGGTASERRLRTWVFRAHGLVLALSCESPTRPPAGFEADLQRLLSMVEVEPEATTPPRARSEAKAPR